MAFFRNSTVNLLNLHYGIHVLALSGGGAFFAVFLLKAGVPAPAVLASMALILAGRFVIRPTLLPLGRRYGLKPMVIAGTLLTAVQYPLLAEVHGVDFSLLALCVVASVGDTLYWTSYHAYFAALGDHEHRGQQIGAREAVAAIVGIAAPLITGWALVAFGPRAAFGFTMTVIAVSAAPLFLTPNVEVLKEAPGTLRAATPGALMFAADGCLASGYFFIWQLAMFDALGESFTAFGGAMAIAATVGAASSLALGRFIDSGHGRWVVFLASGSMAAIMVVRAISYSQPIPAILANAAGALTAAIYVPTFMTAVYNLSKASPCVLRFHIAAEGGWDIGCAFGCLSGAALLTAGVPIGPVMLVSLLGVAAGFALMRRYYGETAQPPQIT